MIPEMLYAHTPTKESPNEWHLLQDHLRTTAKLASEFASDFSSKKSAYVLGLFHDLGKVTPAFQGYLQACSRHEHHDRVPHSICGAAFLWRCLLSISTQDIDLALCCDGHHGGLNDSSKVITDGGVLSQWWNDGRNVEVKRLMLELLSSLRNQTPESLPLESLRKELRLRMLFSALVDADFLDTEKHFEKSKSSQRGHTTRPADLWSVFRSNQLAMMWKNRQGKVNEIRKSVYFSCVELAKQPPGVFRLTVPTGGGKTRSGLAFALAHAVANKAHGFRRVIVALPYTSIIDQNARVYREIFGEHFVLEHHSQVEVEEEDDNQSEAYLRQRLASENWDYPLIVTTTVQLFESLFANRPSKCRKLHNIARSIIILDEVQTLPPELLIPTMDVLRGLVDEYHVTLVLSTATQPALDQTLYLKAFDGLTITEIVPDFESHFQSLKRVEYQAVRKYESLGDLADEIAKPEKSQALVILNTRKHALELHQELLNRNVKDGLYHLSTLLCGAHRKRLLREINERLSNSKDKPVRLISTQVVEAGVDLDFPAVYRVMGPLDRIVQAAGRCNREGKRETGNVIVFDFPDNASPPGAYKLGLEDAQILLQRNQPDRLHDPSIYTEYFQMLFRDVNLDREEIQPYRRDLNYPEVARRYKLIEDTIPVVILSYDKNEGERRLTEHLNIPTRESWRKLMPYIVNLSYRDLHKDDFKECIESVTSGLYKWIGGYDDKTHRGITDIIHDPADLIIGD